MRYFKIAALAFTALAGLSGTASAADPAACETIRLSDPGWTDITSTNSIASVLLEGLGYKPDVKTMSVPIGYEALKTGNLDVFLGNWMPAQQKFRDDLDKAKAAEVIVKNLEGAKFTLAVPDYVASEGVKNFTDLAAHADKFGKEIYGIEPGAPANQNIQKIIEDQKFKLAGWKLVGIERAGNARAGGPQEQGQELGRVPRLGTAPDEHKAEHRISGRRR